MLVDLLHTYSCQHICAFPASSTNKQTNKQSEPNSVPRRSPCRHLVQFLLQQLPINTPYSTLVSPIFDLGSPFRKKAKKVPSLPNKRGPNALFAPSAKEGKATNTSPRQQSSRHDPIVPSTAPQQTQPRHFVTFPSHPSRRNSHRRPQRMREAW